MPQQLSQYGTHLDVISAAQIQDGGYIGVASALEALAPGLYVSSPLCKGRAPRMCHMQGRRLIPSRPA